MSRQASSVASALAIATMLAGPTWFAITGDALPGLPAWRMFEDAGLGTCDVQFADPTGHTLDRYRAHGVAHRFAAPEDLHALDDARDARRVARAFCPEAKRVHIAMRCASPDGWLDEPIVTLDCSE